MRRAKRLVILSDLHSGHEIGLTPPDWQWNRRARDPRTRAVAIQQYETWNWYKRMVRKYSPIDYLVHNGDGVEGPGVGSGGTELITTDVLKQAEMASECINIWQAPTNRLSYGTPYHTGVSMDMEDAIIPLLDSKDSAIHSQLFFAINGLAFDIKHFVSSSSVPHGRYTAIAKDVLWNEAWHNNDGLQPIANILVRSHVHYHAGCFGPDWLAFTTPALQGFGSKFGKRKCAGLVHVGLIIINIDAKGGYEKPILEQLKLESQRVHAREL